MNKVTLTWPSSCIKPVVGSYMPDAHNLTNVETAYIIQLNKWFHLMGTIHNTIVYSHHSSVLPQYLQSWHQSPNITTIKVPNSNMAQMWQLKIHDWTQTSWHFLITETPARGSKCDNPASPLASCLQVWPFDDDDFIYNKVDWIG